MPNALEAFLRANRNMPASPATTAAALASRAHPLVRAVSPLLFARGLGRGAGRGRGDA